MLGFSVLSPADFFLLLSGIGKEQTNRRSNLKGVGGGGALLYINMNRTTSK